MCPHTYCLNHFFTSIFHNLTPLPWNSHSALAVGMKHVLEGRYLTCMEDAPCIWIISHKDQGNKSPVLLKIPKCLSIYFQLGLQTKQVVCVGISRKFGDTHNTHILRSNTRYHKEKREWHERFTWFDPKPLYSAGERYSTIWTPDRLQ